MKGQKIGISNRLLNSKARSVVNHHENGFFSKFKYIKDNSLISLSHNNHRVLITTSVEFQRLNHRLLNYIRSQPHMKYLEVEWGRYKYLVLERSPSLYQKIRLLLKDKSTYPIDLFYRLIDEALFCLVTPEHFINAASHVFGYFKKVASNDEKHEYHCYLDANHLTVQTMKEMKKFLFHLSTKYQEHYLINSFYFYE